MSRVGIAAALVGLLALATLAHAGVEADVGPLDDRLTHPDAPIDGVARNFGVWNPDYEAGGAIRYETLEFRKNVYRGFWYVECAGTAFYHPQHVVRLPNKDGRAYFAASSSFANELLPPFDSFRDPSGAVHFYRSDSVVDPVTDLVPNNPGSDGEIYREEWYHPGSTIGDWNHPGKMQVIGGLLLVSAEQWTGSFGLFCGDYGEGSSQDAVLFYDVRDPENPQYWGRITAGELGVSGSVNDATMIRAGASWILTVQGRMFTATEVMPDIANWTFIGSAGGHGFAETHGDAFYSYEEYDLPATPPVPSDGGAVPSLGERRAMYFDAGEDPSENGGYVSGNEKLDFHNICFGIACGFAPYTNPTTASKRFSSYRSAPNVWGGDKDYDATGIYVSGGAPIVYAPIVNYANNNFDKIFQIHHPENLYETVAEATNDTSRVWRTGGNGGWFAQFSPTHDGVSSAQSSNIADYQATYVETTVEGAGTLTFWWKVSSESGYDFLRFELDGVQQASAPQISGEVDWQQRTVVISTAGPHTLRWTYAKNSIDSAGSDAAWLDQVAFNISIPEAVDQPSAYWTTGGSGLLGGAPFFGQNVTTHDGEDAAQSGNIFSSSSSFMATTVQGPGTLTFWWSVSSEAGFDFLRFTRSGVQPPEAPQISGSVGWQQRTVPIPAGFHTLRWTYLKDYITTAGSDAGWVDQVVYTPSPTIVSNTGDNDEPGSLRRLINELPAGSTVTFDPQALNGATIVLNGSLAISKNFTLDASALPDGLTISVAGASQALYVGAGTVNVNDITFAGAIGPTDGYAVYNAATFNCTRCTFSGNIGGLVNIATATLTNSTVAGNVGGDYGGGILNIGTLTLIHSTVSGNGADVAGGGLHNEGTLQIENSIVAANAAPSGPDISNLAGVIVPGGANLIGNNHTVSAAFPAGPTHGTAGNPLDPELNGLRRTWGSTETALPRLGSPAIDAAIGTPSTPTTDQRGAARPDGAAADLGAVEIARRVVTSSADSGGGSLRQAIADAAWVITDAITFDASLAADPTVTITSGPLLISTDLMIDASSLPDGITLDGDDSWRVLQVNYLAHVSIALAKITNGYSDDSGAAIANTGMLTLIDSSIVGNHSQYAGAILNSGGGALTLRNSTLSGNTSNGSGSALVVDSTSSATLVNTTVSGNSIISGSDGGAILNAQGVVKLVHTTIANNSGGALGGGVDNSGGTLEIENSIVAGNKVGPSGGGADIRNRDGGTVVATGGNLIGDNDTVAVEFPAGALHGTPAAPLDPRLRQLFGHGGATETMPPRADSPAVDAATPTANTPETDQRGLARPSGAAAELGAAELSQFFVTNTADAGPGSLRDVVASSTSGSVIAFDAGLSGGTIALTSGQIQLDKDLAIDASTLPAGVTLSGSDLSRIFQIAAGVSVEIDALTFVDGNGGGGYGGAIFTDGNTRIRNSTFTGNNGVLAGAIFNGATGELWILNSTLAGNQATFSGGALVNDHALMVLIHATISANSCVWEGCGIYNPGGSVWLLNSIVAGNTGSYPGGGRDIGNHEGGYVSPAPLGLVGDNDTVSSEFPAGPLVGTTASPLDPMLGPLADNGGPTRTMALLSGSPAIDAAAFESPLVHATDQRGFARPVGPASDLGAVEFPCDTGNDADCDGIGDVADNCPTLPNADQLDRGGLLTSTPNGRGDLCECGDVTDDGVVDASDVTLYRAVISDPAVVFSDAASIKCLVFDNDDDQSCNLLDVSVLRRAIDGLLPDIPTTCIANVE